MSFQSRPRESWAAPVNIDLLIKVAKVTIIHPFAVWMIPLGLRAQAMSWDHDIMVYAIAYAGLLTTLHFLGILNRQVAYSKCRKIDLGDEVIVITGGASGLGLLIAEVYGMRGATVAVLDVKTLEAGVARGITSYKCDIGDAAQVKAVAIEIERDVLKPAPILFKLLFKRLTLLQLGTPTILINNAGIVNGQSLLNLSIEDINRNFQVNLLSHFYTLKVFLPGMIRKGYGTIVTVSSVLGHLGASQLSDYTAAKAGLIALHKSVSAELSSYPNVKTILVTPGQLSTPLFDGVHTPSSFFGPVLEPIEVAKEVIAAVDGGISGVLAMPFYAGWVELIGIMPVGVQRFIRWASGIDHAMSGFTGNNASKRKRPEQIEST